MPSSESTSLLMRGLRAGYGNRAVLSSLTLGLQSGELLGLVGHNGAGKSTLLKAVAGVLPVRAGEILLDGQSISRLPVHQRIDLGLTYLPQGSPVFSRLTVRENLLVRATPSQSRREADVAVGEALASFPALRGRDRQRAGSLSGGEKQMLALAAALLTKPRFLLLDEPSLGLSPALVTGAIDRLRELADRNGVGVLMVEQKVNEVLRVCDRIAVMKQGNLVYEGSRASFAVDGSQLRELCI